ncbi:DUF2358 domain-containing protein [Prochlorococcus marinus]|uniref:Transcriptional regulator n=1 Tax=Prochlorococcus marinus XMU1408 TaxID=2213228 RepID=A0A318QX81_PROMR|nr:nuclear transport factor 2 family protein [Prochlorococcus marinus]MBW3042401.1 transcriptional regulator [Prochlorococcus marinus str. XMU1408]PYE01135.1 transcriptional regulator [Prochlorococcus marinus XMU1408]
MVIKEKELKKFFNLSYGDKAPTREDWESLYNKNVKFIDPTQEKNGIDAYIKAQDGLINRCDDVYLESHNIAINNNIAFIEWTMGLKIKGIEFLYYGTTRLIFDQEGKVQEHRDYFDFCSGTFGNIPVIGVFIRWLYSRFVD